MRHLICAVLIAFALMSAAQADPQRTTFTEIRELEQSDPDMAFVEMLALAHDGYTPAKDRVGYYYRHGVGTAKDLKAARQWLTLAVADGHPWSFASLARVQLALGDKDDALRLLTKAAEQDRPGVHALLGTAHIDRAFDGASDPALGHQMLVDLARSGDEKSARSLVLRYNWNRLTGEAPNDVVEQVTQKGVDGDANFAEAALVYLTRLNDKSTAVTEVRATLARVPGVRPSVLAPERVRLAADTRSGQFWHAVEEVLDEAAPDDYAKVASTAFWINKNSWVRVLQKELVDLGYYAGRVNARMTPATVRAQNQFCRDMGIWSICATGPLRGGTVRAVAAKIAERKEAF